MIETIAGLSGDTSPNLFCIAFRDTSSNLTRAKNYIIVRDLWFSPDMLFISIFVYNARAMLKDNTGQIRLGCVSQAASVRHERDTSKTTKSRVITRLMLHLLRNPNRLVLVATLSSISRIWCSRVYEILVDRKAQKDASLKSYPGGSFDTSLLYNYVEHMLLNVERYISFLLQYICLITCLVCWCYPLFRSYWFIFFFIPDHMAHL